jgi:hypothetical protein
VVAQLQGVLSFVRNGAVAIVFGAAGCAAPAAVQKLPASAPERVPVAVAPPVGPPDATEVSVLLPDPKPDAEVGRVGDVVLRESDAWRRLLVAHPKAALAAVDLLVFDALVARHARQFSIVVPPERIEEVAAAEERQARSEVASGDRFEAWVWRSFGMGAGEWQRLLRTRAAQRLWHGYVLRYLAGREERAHVRFLVVGAEAKAAEIAAKARAGADFAIMAQQHSEDPSRQQGGELPPFGRDFEHPVAHAAFALQAGEVSAPFRARWGDGERWFVVCCLSRLPANDAPFAAVAAAIDRELAAHPLSPLETAAYTLRWRGAPGEAPVAAPAADR